MNAPRLVDLNFCVVPTGSPKLRIGPWVLIAAVLATVSCKPMGMGNENPMGPSGPLPTNSAVTYAAVGASDVTGIGSSGPCLALFADCPSSSGYVFVAARQLRTLGHTVAVSNLSIPTAVISARVRALGSAHGHQIFGNMLDQLVPFVPTAATLVTVFAGANDVRVILSALGQGAGGSNQEAFIDDQVRAFGEEYDELITGIRRRAPNARIVVLNLPNMGALPFLGAGGTSARQAAQRASVGMTKTAINILTARGVRVADLMCDPRLYQPAIFSADGFHPNDQGYAIFSEYVVQAATRTSYAAPLSSCPPMTLIP
jgi:lysophospholipase L1-like esterase